jgi:hypothetical protein
MPAGTRTSMSAISCFAVVGCEPENRRDKRLALARRAVRVVRDVRAARGGEQRAYSAATTSGVATSCATDDVVASATATAFGATFEAATFAPGQRRAA